MTKTLILKTHSVLDIINMITTGYALVEQVSEDLSKGIRNKITECGNLFNI